MHKYVAVDDIYMCVYMSNAYSSIQYLLKFNIYRHSVSAAINNEQI